MLRHTGDGGGRHVSEAVSAAKSSMGEHSFKCTILFRNDCVICNITQVRLKCWGHFIVVIKDPLITKFTRFNIPAKTFQDEKMPGFCTPPPPPNQYTIQYFNKHFWMYKAFLLFVCFFLFILVNYSGTRAQAIWSH